MSEQPSSYHSVATYDVIGPVSPLQTSGSIFNAIVTVQKLAWKLSAEKKLPLIGVGWTRDCNTKMSFFSTFIARLGSCCCFGGLKNCSKILIKLEQFHSSIIQASACVRGHEVLVWHPIAWLQLQSQVLIYEYQVAKLRLLVTTQLIDVATNATAILIVKFHVSNPMIMSANGSL